MDIKDKLRKIKDYPFGLYLWNEYRRIQGIRNLKKYSDLEFINKLYLQIVGHEINWTNPQRFTEKSQWLKMFYRNDLMPICSDKYAVRSYIMEKGYKDILNEVYGVYDDPNDINFEKLPDKFVIKGTAGSGWNMICHDKSTVNWYWWKKIMRSWLKQDLYVYGREWNYEHLEGKILIEKYLEDDSGELRDYKIFCFNGIPQFMQVDEARFSNHRRVYIKETGEILGVKRIGVGNLSSFEITETHHKLFEIARGLSKEFPFVRVDFYISNRNIYFGELTFFNGSGFCKFVPDEIDFEWGQYLTLPEPNYNIELLREWQDD